MYTVEDLKAKHTKFPVAKEYFKIKAGSWQKLCDKLNTEFAKDARLAELESLVTQLQAKLVTLSQSSDLDILLSDMVYKRGVGSDEIFEYPEALKGEPEKTGKDDWAYFESVLQRRYRALAKIYHPDAGGSKEHMNNLTNAYEIARTFVKNNGGLGK